MNCGWLILDIVILAIWDLIVDSLLATVTYKGDRALRKGRNASW